MRTIQKITTEAELNSVLKQRRKKNFSVLYYSTWCKWCERILNRAEEWKEEEGNETIYLVNSWDLPSAFSSFSITTSPSLVHLIDKKVKVDVEYPTIYSYFTVSRQENS
tara:strand:- start:192 stop:518 length:327 start_codon:yes stop_codon:yes gene_type:complete